MAPTHTPSPTAPTFTFTRRVGDSDTRVMVADYLAAAFDVFGFDLSACACNVELTRENSNVRGTFRAGYSVTTQGRTAHVVDNPGETFTIRVNLNDADGWRATAAHEVIHAIQSQTQTMVSENTQRAGRRSWTITRRWTTWNDAAAFVLDQIARDGPSEAMTAALIEARESGEERTITRTRSESFGAYLSLPWERQAFRLTTAVLRRTGYGPGTPEFRRALRSAWSTRPTGAANPRGSPAKASARWSRA